MHAKRTVRSTACQNPSVVEDPVVEGPVIEAPEVTPPIVEDEPDIPAEGDEILEPELPVEEIIVTDRYAGLTEEQITSKNFT